MDGLVSIAQAGGSRGLNRSQSTTGCGGYLFGSSGQKMKTELLVRMYLGGAAHRWHRDSGKTDISGNGSLCSLIEGNVLQSVRSAIGEAIWNLTFELWTTTCSSARLPKERLVCRRSSRSLAPC